MKEKPIIFNSEMVRAILDGRKTMTRRVVKFLPEFSDAQFVRIKSDSRISKYDPVVNIRHRDAFAACPYGKVGDLLWVRESFFAFGYWIDGEKSKQEFVDRTARDAGHYGYSTQDVKLDELYSGKDRFSPVIGWWKRPSIFMPRTASRITLEITNIRVERLQGISEADATLEGMICPRDGIDCIAEYCQLKVRVFKELWDKINSKREGCLWADNPFVWVIEFKKI